jgi:hypothetical protein
MAEAPEVSTTDVANFTLGHGTAVLRRCEFTDSIAGHDAWLDNSQIAIDGCNNRGDPLRLVTAGGCAVEALSLTYGGQR